MISPSPPYEAKKRKRDTPPIEELEIDIDAPEPHSKRAQRLAKKGKTVPPKPKSPPLPAARFSVKHTDLRDAQYNQADGGDRNGEAASSQPSSKKAKKKRSDSEYGVWIGNLNWTADKATLCTFLTERGGIPDSAIQRIHMPAPSGSSAGALKRAKPAKNKGFAFVDFSTTDARAQAIALSETLMDGRKLLIKDSRNFEGRPAEHTSDSARGADENRHTRSGNPPNKRVFIGNLDFDIDREAVRQHFEQCGDIDHVFLATFEDTGKCKGYAWITYADLEGAKMAVRGWVESERAEEGGDVKIEENGEGDDPKTIKSKPRKRWINVFDDRRLRIEFAEDATVRYQKRFGKGRNKEDGEGSG